MSTEFEATLEALQKALSALKSQQPAGSYSDGYRDGFSEGVKECHTKISARIREALNDVVVDTLMPSAKMPTKSRVPSPDRELPTRLSAPTKDEMVREYLATKPGARYREMNRDLPPYVATRVYALEKRGEVHKRDDGGFELTATRSEDAKRHG